MSRRAWRRRLASLQPTVTGVGPATAFLARSQWFAPGELAELQATLRESVVRRVGRAGPRLGRSVASSGTGGSPTRVRWSVEAMRWQDAAEARSRKWAGVDPGCSRTWVCCNPPDRLRRMGAFLQNTRIVDAGEVARYETRLAKLAGSTAQKPPDVVQGVSNALAALARELGRHDVVLPDTVCISAGNHLTPWYRRALEDVFATPVRERYAISEVGLIAASCEHGALHVSAETLGVEVLDDRGSPVAAGAVGEIAVTMLRNSQSATIRRRVGDVGRIVETPCPCGRGLATIELLGRIREQVALPDGRILAPRDLFRAADDATLVEASFGHLPSKATLEVSIRRDRDSPAFDAARLESLLGSGTNVSVREVERLEPAASGKVALVTQHP